MAYDKYSSLDIEQKFAKVVIDLRTLRPFYSAVYEALERVEDNDRVDSMGVSTNKMVYNSKFVDNLSYSEFLFINLHEICHVALMHVSRKGKRDPQLWNIACDLYVNKFLAEEFNIRPGDTDSSGCITMPKNGCWCSSIDIDTDCAEAIYETFEKQGKENGYFDDSLSSSDISDGEHKQYNFSYTGSRNENNDKHNKFNAVWGSGAGSADNEETFNITLDVQYRYNGDIIDTGEDDLKKENDNKRVLSEAKTRYDMSSNGAGKNQGLLKFKVDDILKSHIDWRKWLTKYCIKARAYDSTFSNPDKRMFYQNAIYPGQSMDESNTLKNIKVCIDTSGSISDDDLSYIFGQIQKLTKQFRIEAEVIAWDTSMKSCGSLNNYTNIKNIELEGRGGTDPACVFKYFDSKQCKVKPIVTLMFTDGYWYMQENSKWAKKYRDTLWVMTKDANKDFKPPFGLLTKIKYD